jgi:hypothetical protein
MRQPNAVKSLTQRPLVKRLLWSGLQAGIAALASLAFTHLARWIWIRVFGEPPPDH